MFVTDLGRKTLRMNDRSQETVMCAVVRNDIGMSPGKVAAQVGHGIELAQWMGRRYSPNWMPDELPCAKIILQASEEEMNNLYTNFVTLGQVNQLIRVIDEGRTEVEPGSMTVIAFVPAPKHVFQESLKEFKLYKLIVSINLNQNSSGLSRFGLEFYFYSLVEYAIQIYGNTNPTVYVSIQEFALGIET